MFSLPRTEVACPCCSEWNERAVTRTAEGRGDGVIEPSPAVSPIDAYTQSQVHHRSLPTERAPGRNKGQSPRRGESEKGVNDMRSLTTAHAHKDPRESVTWAADSGAVAHKYFDFPRAGTESSSRPCCPCAEQPSRYHSPLSNPSDTVVGALLLRVDKIPHQMSRSTLEPLHVKSLDSRQTFGTAWRENYSLGVSASSSIGASAVSGVSRVSASEASGAFVATSVAYSAHAACASVSGVNSPYSREPM
ncbi:MAG: hypothetical protein JWM55_1960 [Acidimicrobiaceae bacterium]|nr:hypothetical protein [Acidimicrobiaceae bacterium]